MLAAITLAAWFAVLSPGIWSGPPTTMFITTDDVAPFPAQAVADYAVCADTWWRLLPQFRWSYPIEVRLRVWEKIADTGGYAPKEYAMKVVRSCPDDPKA